MVYGIKKIKTYEDWLYDVSNAVENAPFDGLEIIHKVLVKVPEKMWTQELFLVAIEGDPCAIKEAPEVILTNELCMAAIEKTHGGIALQYVPEKYKTSELCLAAVKSGGTDFIFEYIPDNIVTKEMCLTAVKKNGFMFNSLPKKFQTSELAVEAVKTNGSLLSFVPEKLRTTEMCLAALGGGYRKQASVEDIPHALWQNAEFCEAAVKIEFNSIFHVSEKIKTEEMCRNAFNQHISAFTAIPENFRTLEMYKKYYRGSYYGVIRDDIINEIPEKIWQSEDFCNTVLDVDFRALYKVPDVFKTAEFCIRRLKKVAIEARKKYDKGKFNNDINEFLALIPKTLWDQSHFCKSALKITYKAFTYISENFKTVDVCLLLTKTDDGIDALDKVPDAVWEQRKFLKAVTGMQKSYTSWLKFMPDKVKTPDICLAAVQNNGFALEYVPLKMRNYDICIAAIKNCGKNEVKSILKYVPKNLKEQVIKDTE